MKSIIVAYPIKNTALQIKNVLETEGFYVSHICATGASVLNITGDMRGGVIVCASILRDISAAEIAEQLPPGFDIVALSKTGRQEYTGNYITLPLPLQREEFVNTVAVLMSSEGSFTSRSKDDSELISKAKTILKTVNKWTEGQAHKYLQQESMRSGKKIAQAARDIIKQFS